MPLDIQQNPLGSDTNFQESGRYREIFVRNDGEHPSEFPEPSYRRFWVRFKSNLHCKARWPEVNGSLGDLGTFIPIVIALTLVNGLDLGTTLIFTGVYNIITGLFFGVPMPVQPMKAIAAVAISEGKRLTIAEIMAAGICTAGTLLGLGVTGLMGLMYRLIPLPVIGGVQLSQGLSFAFTAVKYIRKNQGICIIYKMLLKGYTPRSFLKIALCSSLLPTALLPMTFSNSIDIFTVIEDWDEETKSSVPSLLSSASSSSTT